MANKTPLGEIKHVDPRTVWAHEERDFTPWLYGNLGKLGEALGLELEAEEREADVGDFAVDIIARDLGTGRLVVIENQLEATDHTHLGQLLTYAAGREAGVVVWVSPEFRDEHREALDWLNREGGEGRPEFFGVKLEVLQIDSSNPAVNFRPVSFPNDWTRDVNQKASGDVSERRQKYQSFFQALIESLRERKWTNAKKGQPQSWYSFSSGVKGYIYAVAFAAGKRFRVELYIDLQDVAATKAAFDRLYEQKEAIEGEFGAPLSWEKLDTRRACRVAYYHDGSIDDPAEALASYRAWAIENMLKLSKVLGPRLPTG